MRLLNTSTLTVQDFICDIPPYAILSHRWEEEEVTFQDLNAGRGPNMKGYRKLQDFCRQALSDGWEWVWMDTCCIDKSSSAELSEAINSMFAWYRQSRMCYSHLSDVPSQNDLSLHRGEKSAFRLSQWFKRGWTLQELLAPDHLLFYDQDWLQIGTKSELREVIQSVTGIRDLLGYKNACIARKMSWAANRETTRVEDTAYSLLGIFDVNMPLLYGEGEKAFIRLQLEIIKISDDDSIFAWFTDNTPAPALRGLLAPPISLFSGFGHISRLDASPRRRCALVYNPYMMTNKGLHTVARLLPAALYTRITLVLSNFTKNCLILSCQSDNSSAQISIGLSQFSNNQYTVCFRGYMSPTKQAVASLAKQVNRCDTSEVYVYQPVLEENLSLRPSVVLLRHDAQLDRHWRIQGARFYSPSVDQINVAGYAFALKVSGQLDSHEFYCYSILFEASPETNTGAVASKFVVLISRHNSRIGIELLAPRDYPTENSIQNQLSKAQEEGIWTRGDRATEQLSSGETVHVALKPTSQPAQLKDQEQARGIDHWYYLEVDIQEPLIIQQAPDNETKYAGV